MRGIHPNVPHIAVVVVDDGEIAGFRRQHLQTKLHGESKWRRYRPALILRIGKASARGGKFAFLFDDCGGEWRQDGIVIRRGRESSLFDL